MTIGLVSGRDFAELKGVCELLAEQLCTGAGGANTDTNVSAQVHDGAHHALFSAGKGAELALNGQHWGYLGPISDALADRFKLAASCTVAELRLDVLESASQLVAQYEPLTAFPAVERELNLVIDEAVTWQELADIVRAAAGKHLEDLQFLHLYRGAQVPSAKKSLHFRIVYRAPDRTLTSEEVEAFQQAVLSACQNKLDATLRG
jgi:phenylalanyl-tRNA synthetase beta chain